MLDIQAPAYHQQPTNLQQSKLYTPITPTIAAYL